MENISSKYQKFQNFLQGHSSPKFMALYFGSTLVFYLIIIILSQLFFPGGYSILDYTISAQGGIADNPDGWFIYCSGIIIVGMLLIPYHIYIYQRMQPTLLFVSRSVLFFSLIGCIGFSLLGVFPHDYQNPHDIATALAFGGFILAAVLSFLVLIRKRQLNESSPSKLGLSVAFIHWWGMVVIILAIQELDDWFDMSRFDPRLFSYSVAQWTAMITVLIWMMGMFFNTLKK